MKIAVLDDYAGVALKMADWDRLSADITVFDDTLKDERQLVQRLRPFHVLCVMRERTPLPERVIKALPNLQLIVTTGARNASIDVKAATVRGITVCGTETRKTTTSELTMLLILTLSRGLLTEVEALNTHGWQGGVGRDLNGLTLGLIGLGRIGEQVASLGKGFGMSTVAWSQNLSDERCRSLDVKRAADLQDLMSVSDVVSVHMVLSDRTRHLIDGAAFAGMKPGALFINTSRAGIVDTAALLAGLREGRPFMAGLDVFDEEPLPLDSPLRDPDLQKQGRLLLTPHLGYVTVQTFSLFYQQTVDAIEAWQKGQPIREIR